MWQAAIDQNRIGTLMVAALCTKTSMYSPIRNDIAKLTLVKVRLTEQTGFQPVIATADRIAPGGSAGV